LEKVLYCLGISGGYSVTPVERTYAWLSNYRRLVVRYEWLAYIYLTFVLMAFIIHLGFLDESIEQVSEDIEERLRPFEGEVKRLDTIPGINQRITQVVLAEVGPDLRPRASQRY
jgi:hypothetical protein